VLAGLIHQARSCCALYAGDHGEALRLAKIACSCMEQAGDRRHVCNFSLNMGYMHLALGDYAEAERVLRRVAADAEAMGLFTLVPAVMHNLGLVLALGGRIEEGRALEEEALTTFAARGEQRGVTMSRGYLARIALLAGDLDRAIGLAGEVAAEPPSFSSVPALATLAEARLAAGRVPEALDAAREGMAVLASLGSVDEGEEALRHAYARALAEARDRLLARAAKIGDPALRRSFLERVPDNARVLSLAAQWTTGT
jgi:tetratricopeptide (TPR) repeat protein